MSSEEPRGVQQIGFILMPGFALMSYASAIEPLRAANLLAGRELYRVVAFSPEGAASMSSSGIPVPALALPRSSSGLHSVFVCAGGEPSQWNSPPVFTALRQLSREGVRIGGISGGPYVLAAAGLLANRRFTVHWEHAPALREAFPYLEPERARYVVDGNRITCGGGVAPLDMMHALISDRMGPDFARRVSDWYLHTHVGTSEAPQRASLAERYGVHHPVLLSVIEKMEATIEAPLGRDAMASFAGVSSRHLDRLFTEHLQAGFLETYRRLRLEHARQLLRQSPLSVSEIAYATGFSSSGHFSRCYCDLFGHSPRETRRS
ncbi:GlxA family transcriptional regulator [Roseibium sp.]|uniref:GlxA family transcriptional regulator n=1 Tax=Roseibium sp. TaxID=1936156 RepID=UPI003A98758B